MRRQFLSKNFELMSQLGRIKEVEVAPLNEIHESAALPPVPSGPSLEMDGMVRNEITKLVQNLWFRLPEGAGPRRVVFTGSESGNGCTWMCARAAEILASLVHGTVCVVDCGFRSASLHEQFAVKNHYGLADSLLKPGPIRDFVRPLSRPNLWMLSAGSGIENWQVLLTSKSLRQRLMELRAHFDYVLVDSSPLNTSHDAIVLGGLSDGVVLVLKANASRRETARKVLHELKAANIPVFGTVLNQRAFPIPDRIYKLL
jgi:Mrp family chromosome partitioning ATPase